MELRAKEANLQFKLDGVPLGNSFLTVMNFSLKADVEKAKKRFIGEKRAAGDLDVKGYDFSFKIQKRAHDWWALWKKFEAAELNGDAFPVLTIAVSAIYRNSGSNIKTYVLHGDLVLSINDDIPEGYQEVTVEGFCSYATGN